MRAVYQSVVASTCVGGGGGWTHTADRNRLKKLIKKASSIASVREHVEKNVLEDKHHQQLPVASLHALQVFQQSILPKSRSECSTKSFL